MSREAINVPGAAGAIGPLTPAVRSGGLVFLSGQVALDPATGEFVGGDARAQARQILENIEALLRACGKSLSDVARVGVYLTDMGDYAAVNEVYSYQFSAPYPARTTIGVAALPLGATVEMDAVVT